MADAHHTDSCDPVNRSKTKTWHGFAGTRIYRVWQAIKQRCLNPKCKEFSHYGGRGITICDQWRDSFIMFKDDMGEPESPSHEIERIDNNKGYEPGNCRWATRSEQMRNTRRSNILTFNGKTQVLSDWAKKLGISPTALGFRLRRWGLEDALSTTGPRRRTNSPARSETCRLITCRGETKCLTEWADHLGIKVATLHRRLKAWGVERAISTPLLRRGGKDSH